MTPQRIGKQLWLQIVIQDQSEDVHCEQSFFLEANTAEPRTGSLPRPLFLKRTYMKIPDHLTFKTAFTWSLGWSQKTVLIPQYQIKCAWEIHHKSTRSMQQNGTKQSTKMHVLWPWQSSQADPVWLTGRWSPIANCQANCLLSLGDKWVACCFSFGLWAAEVMQK